MSCEKTGKWSLGVHPETTSGCRSVTIVLTHHTPGKEDPTRSLPFQPNPTANSTLPNKDRHRAPNPHLKNPTLHPPHASPRPASPLSPPTPTSQNPTRTPAPGCNTISAFKNCSPSPQYLCTPSNRCRILTTVYPISANANPCPTQIRGPPLNGIYCQLRGAHPPSQRCGAKHPTSGKPADGGGWRP